MKEKSELLDQEYVVTTGNIIGSVEGIQLYLLSDDNDMKFDSFDE